MGVYYYKKTNKWSAFIFSGKSIFLGYFPTPEAASAAYKEAKKKLHLFQPELRENAISIAKSKSDNGGST